MAPFKRLTNKVMINKGKVGKPGKAALQSDGKGMDVSLHKEVLSC